MTTLCVFIDLIFTTSLPDSSDCTPDLQMGKLRQREEPAQCHLPESVEQLGFLSRPLNSTVHSIHHLILLGSSVEANCRNIRKHREANGRIAITYHTQKSPEFHLCCVYLQTFVNDVLDVSNVPKLLLKFNMYYNFT